MADIGVIVSDKLIREIQINPDQETVWLTQKQMEVLFDVKHATVSEHIARL